MVRLATTVGLLMLLCVLASCAGRATGKKTVGSMPVPERGRIVLHVAGKPTWIVLRNVGKVNLVVEMLDARGAELADQLLPPGTSTERGGLLPKEVFVSSPSGKPGSVRWEVTDAEQVTVSEE